MSTHFIIAKYRKNMPIGFAYTRQLVINSANQLSLSDAEMPASSPLGTRKPDALAAN
jgi:hypothetical protein